MGTYEGVEITHNILHGGATRGASVAVQHEPDIVLPVSLKVNEMLLERLDLVVDSGEMFDVRVRAVAVFEADEKCLVSATISEWAG